MKILDMTEATRSLASYTSEVAEEPLVVTADGQPVAALMGIANSDLGGRDAERDEHRPASAHNWPCG